MKTLYELQIALAATVADLAQAPTIQSKRRLARKAQAIRIQIREA